MLQQTVTPPPRGGTPFAPRRPGLAAAALLALAALTVGTAASPCAAATAVPFINEFHYDNDGGDVGEGVEIAGPAFVDLAGYTLYLYNGSNGEVYASESLTGVLGDEAQGFGTLFVPLSALQNGPDGIALVAPDLAVLQFLSYEGSFVATDGPAAGLASQDVGVFEPGDTPPGSSLQLVGTGRLAADFTWSGPAPASFGAVNAGQNFAAVPLPGAMGLLAAALALAAGTGRRRDNRTMAAPSGGVTTAPAA